MGNFWVEAIKQASSRFGNPVTDRLPAPQPGTEVITIDPRFQGNPLAQVYGDEGMGQSTTRPPAAPESRAKDLSLLNMLGGRPSIISDSKGIAAGMGGKFSGPDIHSPVDLTGEGPGAGEFTSEGIGRNLRAGWGSGNLGGPLRSKQDPAPDYSKQGLTSAFDLKRLGVDLAAAKAGDPGAKARVQAIANSPALSDIGTSKPKPAVRSLPAAKDLTSMGLATATLPAARDLSAEGMIPATLPAAKPVGGGGVEVADKESGQKRDWGLTLGMIGQGLTDIGNAVGNPRARMENAFGASAMQRFQTQQMEQLKQRQEMWANAFQESQQLPSEVLTDPNFASLAQAKAALDKDMLDGRIDNEKNVSGFLTEMARHKRSLEDLGIQTKAEQGLRAEEAVEAGRGKRRADLEARRAQGDPVAAAILAQLGPTAEEKWKAEEAARADTRQYQLTNLEQNKAYQIEAAKARQDAANQAYAARQDAIRAQGAGRRGNFVSTSFENAIRRRIPDQATLSEMDPVAREAVMTKAQEQALVEITPRLIAAARASGIKVTTPDEDVTLGLSVNGQKFENPNEFAMYLLGELGG